MHLWPHCFVNVQLFLLNVEKLELVFPFKSTSFPFVQLGFKLSSIPPFITLMPLSSFDTDTGALISSLSVTTINCCDHYFTGSLTIAVSGLVSLESYSQWVHTGGGRMFVESHLLLEFFAGRNTCFLLPLHSFSCCFFLSFFDFESYVYMFSNMHLQLAFSSLVCSSRLHPNVLHIVPFMYVRCLLFVTYKKNFVQFQVWEFFIFNWPLRTCL